MKNSINSFMCVAIIVSGFFACTPTSKESSLVGLWIPDKAINYTTKDSLGKSWNISAPILWVDTNFLEEAYFHFFPCVPFVSEKTNISTSIKYSNTPLLNLSYIKNHQNKGVFTLSQLGSDQGLTMPKFINLEYNSNQDKLAVHLLVNNSKQIIHYTRKPYLEKQNWLENSDTNSVVWIAEDNEYHYEISTNTPRQTTFFVLSKQDLSWKYGRTQSPLSSKLFYTYLRANIDSTTSISTIIPKEKRGNKLICYYYSNGAYTELYFVPQKQKNVLTADSISQLMQIRSNWDSPNRIYQNNNTYFHNSTTSFLLSPSQRYLVHYSKLSDSIIQSELFKEGSPKELVFLD
ncbi:MAG: hypothetical protein GY810_31955 [Aureispira sp.]|nr:hypothetical protein [Aureispira sp.]